MLFPRILVGILVLHLARAVPIAILSKLAAATEATMVEKLSMTVNHCDSTCTLNTANGPCSLNDTHAASNRLDPDTELLERLEHVEKSSDIYLPTTEAEIATREPKIIITSCGILGNSCAFAEDPTMNTTTPLEDSETEAELSEAEIAIDERSTKVNKDLTSAPNDKAQLYANFWPSVTSTAPVLANAEHAAMDKS